MSVRSATTTSRTSSTVAQRLDAGQDGDLGAHLVGPEVRTVDDDAQPQDLGAGQPVGQGER